MNGKIESLLRTIYPEQDPSGVLDGVDSLISRYRKEIPDRSRSRADETTAVMITYGDQFSGPDGPPLLYLRRFLDEYLPDIVTGVHILPFCPYSSDDGFSVIDYRKVDPALGGWVDIEKIADRYVFMADLVLNHCSAGSEWFQRFLAGEEPWRRYFITVDKDTDLSSVVRPRALPVLTPFETAEGTRHVWTTFSADQVDLNFATPEVLLEMLDIFLMYISRGADIIRLDAIAYLWKEIGTSCIHHPVTHAVVKLFRAVVDELAPWVVILTETNVPHQENISYFGDGTDEAHMVYQFSLPPLTLDACIRGDATHLTEWASSLPPVDPGRTFFNFLASHDGIGVTPARGYLSETELENLISTVQERGGRVSYKAVPGGKVPYELNINYLDAVSDHALPDEERAGIFLTSQAVMLSMAGVPGIYVHSLLGSRNWEDGVAATGMNRSINREKLRYDTLVSELEHEDSLRRLVLDGYRRLLGARSSSGAFHPETPQKILDLDSRVFTVLRGDLGHGGALCLHNLCKDWVEITVPLAEIDNPDRIDFTDLTKDTVFVPSREGSHAISLELQPYETLWLGFRD
jgi:glucosylglycerate phosphorylase